MVGVGYCCFCCSDSVGVGYRQEFSPYLSRIAEFVVFMPLLSLCDSALFGNSKVIMWPLQSVNRSMQIVDFMEISYALS